MKLGLVRHFKVECAHDVWLSATEFRRWAAAYDLAPIRANERQVDPAEWDRCYCSDLPRAVETARILYDGPTTPLALLREVRIAPVCESALPLPFLFWMTAGRIAWWANFASQPESRAQTRRRVTRFLSELPSSGNLLIVSHGFLMAEMQRQLLADGFSGDSFTRAENGKLYRFER
ncbi:histidine phosphatase family protein [Azotosporobacter soli]|uniref:histidine phosphatase family protein n=1 Tax=Azotosporobacter soli TaxID=3055040 RepID=UPI0031FEBBFF